MTSLTSERFLEIARDVASDNEGFDVRCYSGRCMYGKQCVAVELEGSAQDAHLGGLLVFACETIEEQQDMLHLLAGTRADSMGRGSIVYWPSVSWPEGEPDEAECEDY